MSARQLDRLIAMAEQIALNLGAGHDAQAAEKTASHIGRFWTPAMREHLLSHWRSDGEVSAVVAAALTALEKTHQSRNGTV